MTAPETPTAEANLDAIVEHFLEHGGVFKDAHAITDAEMEAVYSVAYNLYKAGKYDEALKVFKFLCFFDHLEKKYWMGLGAAQQLLGKYEDAVQAYSYAALLDVRDPRPPMHAADCYMLLGDREKAESALHATIEFSGDDPAKSRFKERAETLLDMIKTKYAQGGQGGD
jgi:type III secretion system low calcium response chaperone LcrH/SycD